MFGHRFPQHRNVMRAGLLFLVCGALSLQYLARVPHVTRDVADGMGGLCYGLAIGCLLWSARARCRERTAAGEGPGA